MKADCDRESLLVACQLVSAAISSRDLKPILRNFKVIADNGRFTLMATDLELGVRFEVQNLIIEEPGEAILPAAKLTAILREARDERLSVEADTSSCIIRGATLEFEMPGEDPALFPDLPTFDETDYHEIASTVLRDMIRRTAFAAAAEEARYSMTGVLWELDNATCSLVATDGRRLAVSRGGAAASGKHSTTGIMPLVPSKAMGLLERNLQIDEDPVRICFRTNDVQFRTGRAVIYSRLVEGRFPDYKQVLPKKSVVRITFRVSDLLSGVKQAAVMTDEETKRIGLQFNENKLTLQAKGGKDPGRSKVEMPVDYTGSDMTVNLNSVYMIEMLRVLAPDSEVVLEMIDENSPVVFRQGADYSYVVMPLT